MTTQSIYNTQDAVPFKAKKLAISTTVLLRNMFSMKPEIIWDSWYCSLVVPASIRVPL